VLRSSSSTLCLFGKLWRFGCEQVIFDLSLVVLLLQFASRMIPFPKSIANQNYSPEPAEYELTIEIKSGVVTGGGLKNLVHVVIEVDGKPIFQTTDQDSPPVWNESFKMSFRELSPATPSTIVLTAYKKRWTFPGYKLVGSISIILSDLEGILNDGPDERDLHLTKSRRNLTLDGNLIISLELRDSSFGKTPLMSPTNSIDFNSPEGKRLLRVPSKGVSMKQNLDSKQVTVQSEGNFIAHILHDLVDDAKDWLWHFWKHLTIVTTVSLFLKLILCILMILLSFRWRVIQKIDQVDSAVQSVLQKLKLLQKK
jgi:hypothetical protein